MVFLLAQLNRDEALAKGWWNLSMIVLVTLLAVLFFVAMFMLRRWKHRQIKAIEQDRAQRRAGQSAERIDAWQASSERYIDHDKLPEDDDLFSRDDEEAYGDDETGFGPSGNGKGPLDEDEDRDPFSLFTDKPYQEPEDEDDDDFDDGEDWDEEDEEADKP